MTRIIGTILLLLAVLVNRGFGQEPEIPANPSDGTFYAITYPAPSNPRPGELIFAAEWRIWIPPVPTLRAVIVHQHGCGQGSCDTGRTAVDDLHWEALARKYDSALIAVSYRQVGDCDLWCHPLNGSDQSFQNALADFAKMSGHPELTVVPWALWGHSGGGQWVASMVHLHPERIVAAWLRSGHPLKMIGDHFEELPFNEKVLEVPMILNLGTAEDNLPKHPFIWGEGIPYVAMFRARGGKIGLLIDPRTAHETGDSRYPAIRFLDDLLSARLPDTPGSPDLKPSPDGLVLPASELDPRVQSKLPDGIWLPNADFVNVWRKYSIDTSFDDSTPPPPPTDVILSAEGTLRWKAEADLESGLAGFVIRRDGEEIARLPEENRNPFGRPLFQGLSYSDTPVSPIPEMTFPIPDFSPNDAAVYSVAALNTCGLESEAVPASSGE